MYEDITKIILSEEEIADRVKQMGKEISRDYRDRVGDEGILLISVLRGAAIFMADLARAIDIPVEMDYMAVSSYGSGVKTSGVAKILKDCSSDIKGRHVVIAEDVLDSGITLRALMDMLGSREPASIRVATLLKKDVEGQADVSCAYIGFPCPNEFVVGYGLDYNERYRNLPYIGVLDPKVYTK